MPGVGPHDQVVLGVVDELIALPNTNARMGAARSKCILGHIIGPDVHAPLPPVIRGALEPHALAQGVEAEAAGAAGANAQVADAFAVGAPLVMGAAQIELAHLHVEDPHLIVVAIVVYGVEQRAAATAELGNAAVVGIVGVVLATVNRGLN